MALNIKDPETEALAAKLAGRLNTSKTGAIRMALKAQLAAQEVEDRDRLEDVLHVMRTEVWPLTTPTDPISKREREQILGYSSDGV